MPDASTSTGNSNSAGTIPASPSPAPSAPNSAPAAPVDPTPAATPNIAVPVPTPVVATPTILQVTTLPPAPHVPPEPNSTPPGGKFGLRQPDGSIRYVNAHGRPYSDDPNVNMRDK